MNHVLETASAVSKVWTSCFADEHMTQRGAGLPLGSQHQQVLWKVEWKQVLWKVECRRREGKDRTWVTGLSFEIKTNSQINSLFTGLWFWRSRFIYGLTARSPAAAAPTTDVPHLLASDTESNSGTGWLPIRECCSKMQKLRRWSVKNLVKKSFLLWCSWKMPCARYTIWAG